MTTFDSEFFGEKPARPSLASVNPLGRAMARFKQHISVRQRAQMVSNLSDHLLRDIGLDPEEVRGSYLGTSARFPAGFAGGQ